MIELSLFVDTTMPESIFCVKLRKSCHGKNFRTLDYLNDRAGMCFVPLQAPWLGNLWNNAI
jgi:hypothetical protein